MFSIYIKKKKRGDFFGGVHKLLYFVDYCGKEAT
jgi:hypothetical protein